MYTPLGKALKAKYTFTKENTARILKEVGQVFAKVLEYSGVYMRTLEGKTALLRLMAYVKH